jgi:hypothetical protein
MIEILKNAPSWVTWVFSGIGVAIIGWIGIFLFRKATSTKQSQTAGDNSTQIMSGKNTKIK